MNERHDMTEEERFAEQAKRLFDQSVGELDGATLSRLNKGRHAALAELDKGRNVWTQWAPAVGVAAAAVFAVLLWTGGPQVEDFDDTVTADIEILLTEDEFEMLEDLEFYSWIDLDEATDGPQEPANNVG